MFLEVRNVLLLSSKPLSESQKSAFIEWSATMPMRAVPDRYELVLLLVLHPHLLIGLLAAGERVTAHPAVSSLERGPQFVLQSYPDLSPPTLEEPDPASPPAMTRAVVLKLRCDASWRTDRTIVERIMLSDLFA